MKILLVNPPLSRLKQVLNDYFPLGLGYIAAVLREAGYEVLIYNTEKGPEEKDFLPFNNINRIKNHEKYVFALTNDSYYVWQEVCKIFKDFKPDVVGISSMSTTFPSALKVASIAKVTNPDCKVVFGGPHPTIMSEEVLSYNQVDFVVRGEGEDTIVELINTLKQNKTDFQSIDGLSFKKDGKVINNKDRKVIENLDRIPFPARDLIMFKDMYLYPNNRMNTMIASRGCPFKCTFCQARFIWGNRVRFRSVENILAEIESIVLTYNPTKFMFWDDSFTVNRKVILGLCRKLREKKIKFEEGWCCETRVDVIDKELLGEMKRAGCKEVFIGIESGSDKILKEVKKGITVAQVVKASKLLNRMGFIWGAFFMIGFPQETKQDIELTKQLMSKIKADVINLCIFTPYPGSELYDTVMEMGLIPKNIDWSKLSHQSPDNYFSPLIPKEEFRQIIFDVAKHTEKMNSRLLTTLRRAYNKKDAYLRNPSAFLRGLFRNIKIIVGKHSK